MANLAAVDTFKGFLKVYTASRVGNQVHMHNNPVYAVSE